MQAFSCLGLRSRKIGTGCTSLPGVFHIKPLWGSLIPLAIFIQKCAFVIQALSYPGMRSLRSLTRGYSYSTPSVS